MAGLDTQGDHVEEGAPAVGPAPEGAFPIGPGGIKEVKESQRKLTLKKSFRTLASPKKAEKVEKDKNEPTRFLGEGVSFKAKLIGILEVSEARGDRMCQEALADLKMAIRAAGEHKQRININIAIDGLRLRDEKTGDCLYHHPVHKISFIAQDMSDSRAFGYIFGSPDTGHRFFGIKTDKAASQVVIAMRDLFQVVFELKKKEIELAKQHIEQHQIKLGGGLFVDSGSSTKNGGGSTDQGGGKMRTIQEDAVKENGNIGSSTKSSQQTSEVIADLLDLEFELNSIQQGIHQMERITPSDPFGPSTTKGDPFNSDPFGDSFTPTSKTFPPPKTTKQHSITILPPPPSAKESTRSSDPFNVPPPARHPNRRSASRTSPAAAPAPAPAPAPALITVSKPPAVQAPPLPQQEKHWFDQETESLFDEGELVTPPLPSTTNVQSFPTIPPIVDQESQECTKSPPTQFDVFTELDPLGTGRSKPYIDRKDFFQELKNPPKKVLKDLVTEAPSEATAPLFQATFESGSNNLSASDAVACPSSDDVALSSAEPTPTNTSAGSTSTTGGLTSTKAIAVDVDPFADTDPFDKTDPFSEDEFPPIGGFPPLGGTTDPFDTGFADFTMFGRTHKSDVVSASDSGTSTAQDPDLKRISPKLQSESNSQSTFHGPLRVSLPPEKATTEMYVPLPPLPASTRQSSARLSPSPSGGTLTKPKTKSSRLHKQTTLGGMVKLPSPKSSQRSSSRLVKQMTADASCGVTGSYPLRLSPTPPMPPTPSRSDRRSPASQGILESVTLRNRCAITPSPPIVACFPDMVEADNVLRLPGSSAELAEIAPEPPPRPTTNITPIKPPPLPPKRQQVGSIMKPPPRPPHMEDHPHYDYIENYETSSSPTPQETDDIKSPPIPVPARRPRFGEVDLGTVPLRPRRQHPVAATLSRTSDPDYLPPFPLLPPPQKKSPAANSNKVHPSSKPRTPVMTTIASFLQSTSSLTTTPATEEQQSKTLQASTTSLDITLSQLTKTGLSDLAAALGVSPGHLSNMTLQDLTKCLAKLSNGTQPPDNNVEETKSETGAIKRDKYATLRESVDEEPDFKAEFETNFEVNESSEKMEDVFQEAPFDKYAVFRELIGEEKTDEKSEPVSTLTLKDDFATGELKQLDTTAETVVEHTTIEKQPEDKYAALREITLDKVAVEKEEADTSSEKDESTIELTKMDEDYNLLSLSRQASENVDSPTLEVPTLREPQSIIETTIFEEDASALEAENDEALEEGIQVPEELDETEKHCPLELSKTVTNDDSLLVQETSQDLMNESSPSEKDEVIKASPQDVNPQEDEIISAAEGWAKFDTGNFTSEKPISEGQSEGGVSPWSSDGKEFNKVQPKPSDREQDKSRRRRMRRPAHWREDDESEEGLEERRVEDGAWKEKPWRENGWSDGESYYDDAPPYDAPPRPYNEERRGRRRRVSPWKRGQRSSRDASPWEQDGKDEDENWVGTSKRWQERSMDEDEEEEEYEVSWKTRPKHRGSSWDDERQRRRGSRDINGLEYDDGRKRRPSPWRGDGDRRSSFESVSWDEDDRFSQREYSDRRTRGDQDEEYRWRRESEMNSRYVWGRKCMGPDEEYLRQEQALRRKHRYYRDRSRESPWEDEYSEQGEEESPRYQGRKRNWPKRPSSASEMRRTIDKSSPGDYKSRIMEKQQHSLPNAVHPETQEKLGSYGFTERRYREKSGARPRSREGHFNSDQEYEYWPPQERSRRSDRDSTYEQRSQTLHTRRPQRYKKTHDRGYSQKSPFDDDFSMQAFEFSADLKSQGVESDASDTARKKSPILSSHSITPSGLPPPLDEFSKRKDSQLSEPEVRPKDIALSSPRDQQESPLHEDISKTKTSRGSSHRQSPFEDDFTPPETRNASARLMSSISSDVSDHRKSPYEDVRSSCRVQSVVEETECESAIDLKNGKSNDDVFLPADNGADTVHTRGEHAFADFENGAFTDSVSDFVLSPKPVAEWKRLDRRVPGSLWNSEESNKSEKHHPGIKMRMSSLLRVDSSSSLRKSESINIFARENDPFDDDFFSSDVSCTLPRPKSEQTGRTSDKSNTNNTTSDPFRWTKAFDSFNFEEEK